MTEEFKAALVIMPLGAGMTEVATRTGLPERWSLVASLVFGVIMSWGCAWANWFSLSTSDAGVTTMTGIVAGLMSLGLLSGGEALIKRDGGAPSHANEAD